MKIEVERAETEALYDYIFKVLNVKPKEVTIVADELRDLIHDEDAAIRMEEEGL